MSTYPEWTSQQKDHLKNANENVLVHYALDDYEHGPHGDHAHGNVPLLQKIIECIILKDNTLATNV